MKMSVADPASKSRVITTLVAAYYDDPLIKWLYPDYQTYERVFPTLAEYLLISPLEQGYVHISEEVKGVAVWQCSRKHSNENEIERFHKTHLSPEIYQSFCEICDRLSQHFIKYGEFWYLQLLAVEPYHRRQGIGEAILRFSIKSVLEDKQLPALLYTNSMGAVNLYKRVGFKMIDAFRVADSPGNYVMVRELSGKSEVSPILDR